MLDEVRRTAVQLEGPGDVAFLREPVGSARFVLLGEASHGTHEFYRFRAEATKLPIQEFGFDAVAVEADWPDSFAVECFIRGRGDAKDPDEALAGFDRFPEWMWRNVDVPHVRDAGRPGSISLHISPSACEDRRMGA